MFIRKIQLSDNKELANVIRSIISEFDVDPATTIAGDPALETMFENYQDPRTVYYIAEQGGRIMGGAGIGRVEGHEDTCELQRMFLLPEARGRGMGSQLMMLCLSKAREFNYKKVYLETLSVMDIARSLYQRSGFQPIEKPLANTGHTGCNVFMILDLD